LYLRLETIYLLYITYILKYFNTSVKNDCCRCCVAYANHIVACWTIKLIIIIIILLLYSLDVTMFVDKRSTHTQCTYVYNLRQDQFLDWHVRWTLTVCYFLYRFIPIIRSTTLLNICLCAHMCSVPLLRNIY